MGGNFLVSPTSSARHLISLHVANNLVRALTSTKALAPRGKRSRLSTTKLVVSPKLISARVRFHSPKFACGRSLRAKSLTTTTNKFASIVYVTGASPIVSSIPILGRLVRQRTLRSVRVFRTTTISYKLGNRRVASVGRLTTTNTYKFASSKVPLGGTTFLCGTVRRTGTLSLPVDLRRRSPTFVRAGKVGRKPMSSTLNVCKSPSVTRRSLITESYLLTLHSNTRIIVRRVDSKRSIRLMHAFGTVKTGLRTRTAPRRFALASRTMLGCNTLTGVGPPLHARGSHLTVVRNLGSNAVSLVTASRTPRDARRGSHPVARAPDNVVNLRASLTLKVASLMHPKRLALDRLVRGVAVGPTDLCRLPYNSITRKGSTSLMLFSPGRG